MKFKVRAAIAAILAGLLFQACTSKKIMPKPMLGSPDHHVENGFKLLELEKYNAAFREFQMAGELDPAYAFAHLGMGISYAYLREYDKGLESLERARHNAVEPTQEVEVLTGFMRLYTIGNTRIKPDWLVEVKEAFENAQRLDPGMPGPYFYMGLAYKQAGQYDAATDEFVKVFEIGKGFVEAADREYTTIQKLRRKAPK